MDYILNSIKVILSGIILALATGNLIEIFYPELKSTVAICHLSVWLLLGIRYVIIKHQTKKTYLSS
ncbi:MAG: hypothetical protein OEM46_02405 [Ignavibacteria bacterium]|nr:hypothetical protein [Ignavibacteria bacterium]